MPVDGPGLETSAALYPGNTRNNKEIQGTHCCIVPPIPQSWGSSPSCLIFKEFLCLFVTLYLEGFICKEEELAGMGLLQPSGTESNISFSIKNAHLCHLNSTDTLWCFLRRVRLLGWRYQIIPFAANMQANIHLYLSKSNCKHLKIIIWLSHFN